jgi:steroid 5-alpha reductase family enzyme
MASCLIIGAGLILWLLVSPIIISYDLYVSPFLTALDWIGIGVCIVGVSVVFVGIGNLLK